MAVAELPMYDLAELRSATDAWWAGIARALRREGIEDVPDRLTREQSAEGRPDLLLSQVCGSSLIGEGRERLTYVGTPCYTAPGCNGPLYRSVIVVPAQRTAESANDERRKPLECSRDTFASSIGSHGDHGVNRTDFAASCCSPYFTTIVPRNASPGAFGMKYS